MKTRKYVSDIYGFPLYVSGDTASGDTLLRHNITRFRFWSDTERDYCKVRKDVFLEELYDLNPNAATFKVLDKDECCGCYVHFFNTDEDHMTIAHEALHVCDFICQYTSIPLNLDTSEPRAYLLEWALRCIYDYFKNEIKR